MNLRFLVIFLFCLMVSPLFAASFNCSKATTETEIAICADPELSALDEDLGFIYSALLEISDKKET